MESALRLRICLIGSGNVATHLGRALMSVSDIVQVYSQDIRNARSLAEKIGARSAVSSLSEITTEADLYLVAVKDDAIAEVAQHTNVITGIWAHTSGSVPMDVFAPYKKSYGVFYPLQTFSKSLAVNVGEVPIFIEGSDPATARLLEQIASSISGVVRMADSTLRRQLHVAAVFACNFVNLMWIEADELLKQVGLDISFLMPLLGETLRKIERMSPEDAQTGPARRGDLKVIDHHLEMLTGEKRDMYAYLSDIIVRRYQS